MSCRPNYFSVVIVGLFCAAAVEASTAQTVIHTAADLQAVRSNMAAQYVLDSDIDLGGVANFIPIGMPSADADPIPFTGALDGAGHTITGLTQVSTNRRAGLFGRIGNGASITNLHLQNARLTWNYGGGTAAAGNPVPGTMGILTSENDGGTIDNVTVDGTIASTATGSACGGIVGVNVGTISNSFAFVTLTATLNDSATGLLDQFTQIGAIAGRNNAAIRNVRAAGTISVKLDATVFSRAVFGAQVGGLVGLADSGSKIAASNSDVDISAAFSGSAYATPADNPYTAYWNAIGGLVGNVPSASTIVDSFSSGSITVTNGVKPAGGVPLDSIGGLLGSGGIIGNIADINPAGTPTITGSFASTPIKATDLCCAPHGASLNVGGLAGQFAGTIISSYASGSVDVTGEGFNGVGGLVGQVLSGTLTDVKASGSVTSVDHGLGNDVGGLAGTTGAVVTNAISSGVVSSSLNLNLPPGTQEDSTIGGLVGFNYGVIRNAIALSSVTATFAGSVSGSSSSYNDQVAGLVANSAGRISNSSAWGPVSLTSTVATSNGGTSAKMAGGLVGGGYVSSFGTSTVMNSFATGGVSVSGVNDQLMAGALIAYNASSIASSYALGKLSVQGGSGNSVGGLLGRNDVSGLITSSYWDVNTTGINVGVASGSATGAASWNAVPTTIPAGFDPAVWQLADGINGGYPWLTNGAFTQLNIPATDGGAGIATTVDIPAPLRSGYAAAVNTGNPPYGTAVFSLTQSNVVVSEVGVPATIPSTASRIFVELRSGVPTGKGTVDVNTGMAVVNTGSATANVTYTLRDTSGKTLAIGHGTLSARNHVARFIDQLSTVAPDFNLPANFASAVGYGSLDITSTQPLAVLALRLVINQRGEAILTSTPITDLSASSANGPLNFPQFVDGGGYVSSIVLLNTSGTPESGRLTVHADNGSPLLVGQTGGPKAPSFPYAIQPGGVFLFETDGSPEAVQAGWVQVIPDPNTTSPVGAGIFSYTENGVLVTESGVPAAVPTNHARIYVDQSGGHSTGLALANPGTSSVAVTLTAYQTDGITSAGTSPSPITLSGSGHAAAFTSQLISGLPVGFTGVVDISSPTPIIALTLRALVNSRGNFLLTTFPIADLTRPAPVPIVFPHIVDGGGYVTQFILLSAGSTSSTTINTLNESGIPLPVLK